MPEFKITNFPKFGVMADAAFGQNKVDFLVSNGMYDDEGRPVKKEVSLVVNDVQMTRTNGVYSVRLHDPQRTLGHEHFEGHVDYTTTSPVGTIKNTD